MIDVQEQIDYAIKQTWLYDIKRDYENKWLLKEDTLVCSFYFHLRNTLGSFMDENNLKIITEYHIPKNNKFADMVIGEFDEDYNVKKIFAIIEFKYKGSKSGSDRIPEDIEKLKQYKEIHNNCQFYIADIDEYYDYTFPEDLSWYDRRMKWGKGCFTELNAAHIDSSEKIGFYVYSHNDMNRQLHCKNKEKDIHFTK